MAGDPKSPFIRNAVIRDRTAGSASNYKFESATGSLKNRGIIGKQNKKLNLSAEIRLSELGSQATAAADCVRQLG